MSADPPTCPYCNAQLPIGAWGRVTCPRCGELSTVMASPATGIQPAPSTALQREPTPAPPQPAPKGKPVRANRIVGGIVVGVMLMMGAIGLTYALMTVDVRRSHDKSLPRRSRKPFERFRKAEPEPVEIVAPARLAGLGYLPAGTNLVAGIHVEELLGSPAGKQMRQQAFKVGNLELRLDSLKDRLGLAVEDVDHIVVGVEMHPGEEADLTPPAHLVIRTRRPYDANQVRAALGAQRPREVRLPGGRKRSVFEVKVQNVPLLLWLADPTTLVLGLFSKMDLLAGHEPSTGPSAEVWEVLKQRIGAGTPLWLAGDSPDWRKTVLPGLLAGWKDLPVGDRLAQVRTFVVWLQPDKQAKVLGAFRCTDEASARQIAQKDLVPRQKGAPETFTFSRDKEWLTVQMSVEGRGQRGEK